MRKWALAAVVLPAVLLANRSGSTELVTSPVPSIARHSAGELSILTYNVQDLPWPLAGDRSTSLTAIGARLKIMRAAGSAPQLVVLQEGFSDNSTAMLRAAGYAHIWVGPSSSVLRNPSAEPLDASFLANRSTLLGEAQAPSLSSGLVIASDYPIRNVVGQPFPANVCAGFDCLANKGIMLARIDVPGLAKPLDLVTTHLNAGRKSRTAEQHNLYAYREQLKVVSRFLAAYRDPASPAIFAGDFNVSHSKKRLASLQAHQASWGMAAVTAMGKPKYQADCVIAKAECSGPLPIAANVPLIHTLDWQFKSGDQLQPINRTILFGKEAEGGMLSDHVGFAVRYRIAHQP